MQARIEANHWPNGTMIPGLRRLAKDYGVSHVTVQHAVQFLVGKGILRSDLGRGTYVAYGAGGNSSSIPGDTNAERQTPVSDLLQMSANLDNSALRPVGIIDAQSLTNHIARSDSYNWIDTIATNVERELSNYGGRTQYFAEFGAASNETAVSDAVEVLVRQNVGGIVLIDIFDDNRARAGEAIAAVDAERVPFVVVTWKSAPLLLPHVCYDNRIAGYQAADHLLRSGYNPIAFVAPFSAQWVDDRYSGASEAVRDARFAPDTLATWPRDWRTRQPYDQFTDYSDQTDLFVGQYLVPAIANSKNGSRPAVIVAHDHLGLQVLRAAKQRHLVPGSDFGVIGFDDDPKSRQAGLTTLRPPVETLGKEAARMISHLMRRDSSYLQLCLRSQLLVRSSTDRRNSAR